MQQVTTQAHLKTAADLVENALEKSDFPKNKGKKAGKKTLIGLEWLTVWTTGRNTEILENLSQMWMAGKNPLYLQEKIMKNNLNKTGFDQHQVSNCKHEL